MRDGEIVSAGDGPTPATVDPAFAARRDQAIATLILVALTFPHVEHDTGYPPVPYNTLSRIAGLLHCRNPRIVDEATLEAEMASLGVFVAETRISKNAMTWRALRHAQSGMEGVSDALRRPAGPAVDAEAIIGRTLDHHVARLLELVDAESFAAAMATMRSSGAKALAGSPT